MDGFFAALIFFAGAYMLSSAIQLKKTGTINKNLCRTPANAMRPIVDMEGFVSYIYPRLVRSSVIAMVTALWLLFQSLFKALFGGVVYTVLWTAIALVFLFTMWKYVQDVKKAEEKYCRK